MTRASDARSCRWSNGILLDLGMYRRVLEARDFIARTLDRIPFVLGVHVRLFADGTMRLVISTTALSATQRACLPTGVNSVKTEIEESA